MTDQQLPPAGFADVRIIAGDPDTARQIARVLRDAFTGTEQRSYPAGPNGTGTRLHLTLDTSHVPDTPPPTPARSPGGDHPHPGEL